MSYLCDLLSLIILAAWFILNCLRLIVVGLGPWQPLWSVIVGGGLGWLAARAFPRRGLRLWGNVAVGIAGAFVGGHLFLFIGLLEGPFGPVGAAILLIPLWFVILGAVFGWLVGRAFLGLGPAGNVVLAVIGAVGGLFLGPLAMLFVPQIWPGLMPTFCGLCNASIGAVACLAVVITFVRRR